MACKPKYELKNIHNIQNPSTTSKPSRYRSKSLDQKFGIVETSPSSPKVVRQPPSPDYTFESPKVHSLIQKLEQISISAEKPKRPEVYEESVTSLLQQIGVLTRLQSERFGITPFEFPIPPRHRKVTSLGSDSDTSKITSPFQTFTSPFTSTQSTTSQLSTSPISTATSSTNPVVSSLPSIPTSGSNFPYSES